MIHSGSEVINDSGVELVGVRKVKVEAAATSKPFRAQGALVEAAGGMEDEGVVLEFVVTDGSEDAVWAVERRQERRHALVGRRRWV